MRGACVSSIQSASTRAPGSAEMLMDEGTNPAASMSKMGCRRRSPPRSCSFPSLSATEYAFHPVPQSRLSRSPVLKHRLSPRVALTVSAFGPRSSRKSSMVLNRITTVSRGEQRLTAQPGFLTLPWPVSYLAAASLCRLRARKSKVKSVPVSSSSYCGSASLPSIISPVPLA